MNEIPVSQFNDLTKSIICDYCKEDIHYADDIVFLLSNEVVSVSEQHPDWDKAVCTTCAEEKGLI